MSQRNPRQQLRKFTLQNQHSESLSIQNQNLQQSYGRFQEKSRRAISLFQDSTNKQQNLPQQQPDQQDSHRQLLDDKVLLCFPNNYDKQKDSYGFVAFKQLKVNYLQCMPAYMQQKDTMNELFHNKKMKSLYVATMFKRHDLYNQDLQMKQKNINELQLNQSKGLVSVERQQRSLPPLNRTKPLNRGVKDQLEQAENELYLNKFYGGQTKPNVCGFVLKIKSDIQPYIMPECREGSKAIKISDQKAILVGGFSYKDHQNLQTLDINSFRWDNTQQYNKEKQMKAVGCGFQALWFQETIYLIGGERRVGGRSTTNELWMFRNNKWDQIIYGGDYLEPRKDFAAVLANKGTQLIVIGGVGGEQNFLNDLHAIDLIQNKNINLNLDNTLFENGIAYHCCFTIPFDQGGPDILLYSDYKKKQLKSDEGIYIFGGKNNVNRCYSSLYMIKTNCLPHKVEEIATKGRQPAGRQSFSLNYSTKGNMVVIFGGTDGERIFNDLFLLFVANMQWVMVKLYGDQIKARFGHCSIFTETSIVVFGGVCSDGFLTYEPYVIELNQENTKLLMQQITSQETNYSSLIK